MGQFVAENGCHFVGFFVFQISWQQYQRSWPTQGGGTAEGHGRHKLYAGAAELI
jgi:hypothetical protein